ncbi:CBS domain-containing protein [soil metagenome]
MATLKEVLKNPRVHFVKSGMNIYDVVKFMDLHNIGAVPILKEGNKLAGIFSERDLLRRCASKNIDLKETTIDEVMTSKVIVIESGDTVEYALKIMRQENIRHMPVIEGKDMIGMLSIRDLLYYDMQAKEEKIEMLNNYIQYNG